VGAAKDERKISSSSSVSDVPPPLPVTGPPIGATPLPDIASLAEGSSGTFLEVIKGVGLEDATSESDSFQSFKEGSGSESEGPGGVVVVGSELSPSHTDIVRSRSNLADAEDDNLEDTDGDAIGMDDR
jgi:hypothetical protein